MLLDLHTLFTMAALRSICRHSILPLWYIFFFLSAFDLRYAFHGNCWLGHL